MHQTRYFKRENVKNQVQIDKGFKNRPSHWTLTIDVKSVMSCNFNCRRGMCIDITGKLGKKISYRKWPHFNKKEEYVSNLSWYFQKHSRHKQLCYSNNNKKENKKDKNGHLNFFVKIWAGPGREATVGVKNLLQQGSNCQPLDNQLDDVTVPSRNSFLYNDFESTTFTKPNLDMKS